MKTSRKQDLVIPLNADDLKHSLEVPVKEIKENDIVKIGKTRVINVGRKGKIIEI